MQFLRNICKKVSGIGYAKGRTVQFLFPKRLSFNKNMLQSQFRKNVPLTSAVEHSELETIAYVCDCSLEIVTTLLIQAEFHFKSIVWYYLSGTLC